MNTKYTHFSSSFLSFHTFVSFSHLFSVSLSHPLHLNLIHVLNKTVGLSPVSLSQNRVQFLFLLNLMVSLNEFLRRYSKLITFSLLPSSFFLSSRNEREMMSSFKGYY